MKKYRGNIRLSHEMIQKMLGLPEEVEVMSAHSDHRDVVDIRIRSNEETPITFLTGEWQDYRNTSIERMVMKAAIRKTVGINPELYESLLHEVLLEDGQLDDEN